MVDITYLLNTYYEYIILGTAMAIMLSLIIFIVVLRRLNKTRKQYQFLLEGMENKNLEDLILENKRMTKELGENFRETSDRLQDLEKGLTRSLKNIALQRYDAFASVGGKQSFSIALLNDHDTGFVISTIHGREDSRTYAKEIVNGKSVFPLSEEEKMTISKAISSQN